MVLVVDLKIHIKSGIFSIVFNERMVILYVDRSGSCGNTQDLEFFGEYSGACSLIWNSLERPGVEICAMLVLSLLVSDQLHKNCLTNTEVDSIQDIPGKNLVL